MSQPAEALAAPRATLAAIAEDGFLSGVLGGAVVALFFLALDALEGQPFRTPSILGRMVFLGADPAEGAPLDPPMVVTYTALHMALFVGVGMAAAWTVFQFEERPHLGVVLILLFLCFEAGFLAFTFAFAPGVIGELGGVQVAVANALSAGAMAAFLFRRHPHAWRHLDEVWRDETPSPVGGTGTGGTGGRST